MTRYHKSKTEARLYHLFLKEWQERKLAAYNQHTNLSAMDPQSENIMLQEECITDRFQNKCLRERVGWIIIRLQLSKDIDQNSTIKHRLTIHFGDDVLNFLERQTL